MRKIERKQNQPAGSAWTCDSQGAKGKACHSSGEAGLFDLVQGCYLTLVDGTTYVLFESSGRSTSVTPLCPNGCEPLTGAEPRLIYVDAVVPMEAERDCWLLLITVL